MGSKQYDKTHKVQRLYVHWDISTQCSLKCSYCYAWKQYGEDWGKLANWPSQQLVIHALDRATLPIFLGLLGGEPTDHPRYLELLEKVGAVISKHKDSRLYITTNGLQDRSFFKEHPIYPKTYFLFSFHPEYESKYGENFQLLLDNIKTIKDKGFKVKVNVMLHHRKFFWAKTHTFVDALEKMDGLEIHPHFLYEDGDVHKLEDYSSMFFKEFSRFKDYPGYLVYEEGDSKEILNDYEVFTQDRTAFKGWTCWNNNYEISWNGRVARFCFEEHADLMADINYFKNITEVTPKICPHESCNCDGLLKIYKERNEKTGAD
jgi:hypothetical protein